MITVWNRRSVYIGFDMQKCAQVRECLAQNHIDYTYKVRNQMGSWAGREGTVRGRTGSFGQSLELMYEYEVFVHQKDLEQANYLLGKGL